MDSCPSSETLQIYLSGDLAVDQSEDVRRHIDQCLSCTAELDTLADAPELRDWLATDLADATMAQEAGLLRLLSTVRTPGFGFVETFAAISASLAFLGPARAAGELGTLGPYRIEKELGRGGMGIVFLAHDETLRRTVAIKVLRPDHAEDAVARARFVREARSAARVSHESIVGVHAVVNPPDGPPYLVMEYVAGPTLRDEIAHHKRLASRAAAAICAQVADGLEVAHAAGLIHRDIKPSNILLACRLSMADEETEQPKITDFGLARMVSGASKDLTQDGTLLGTPAYASPEQIRDPDQLDARTDVYSLGVTLYEALTGEEPFRGSLHRILEQVTVEDPLPPSRLNETIPADLETVCLKAMAKEPERRYQTATEFSADLRSFLAGDPVRARRSGMVERSRRWCRRNPRLATMTGAAAGLLVLLAISSTVAAFRITGERQAALDEAGRADRNAVTARENFDIALGALNTIISGVQEQLEARPGTLAMRGLLVEEALNKLEQIAAGAEKDPNAQDARFIALYRLGDVYLLAGRTADARRRYEEAWRLADARHQEVPNAVPPMRYLALAHERLGDLDLRERRPLDARRHYDRAFSLHTAVAELYPDDFGSQLNLARSLTKVGRIHYFMADHAAARSAHRQSRALLEPLLDQNAQNPRLLEDLWLVNVNLGDAHLYLLEIDDAIGCYERALDLASQLSRRDPAHLRWRRNVAEAHVRIGDATMQRMDYEVARKHYLDALDVRQGLVQIDPTNLDLTRELAAVHYALGSLGLFFHKFDDGEASFRQALALCEELAGRDPNSSQSKIQAFMVCFLLATLEQDRERFQQELAWLERAGTLLEALRKVGWSPDALLKTAVETVDLREALLALAATGLHDDLNVLQAHPPPVAAWLLYLRGRSLALRGRHADAAEAAEVLRGLRTGRPTHTLFIARTYARCAGAVAAGDGQKEVLVARGGNLQDTYAEAAVTALREWVTAQPHALPMLAFYRDLDPIRGHAAYQRLIEDLVRPGQTGSAGR